MRCERVARMRSLGDHPLRGLPRKVPGHAQQLGGEKMVSGDRSEVRVSARLPNLDIAVLHHAGGEGEGEQVILALRAVPSFAARQDLIGANPVLFWMRLSQAFWGTWLGYLSTLTTPPWLIRTE
jgi:hypothetical protein